MNILKNIQPITPEDVVRINERLKSYGTSKTSYSIFMNSISEIIQPVLTPEQINKDLKEIMSEIVLESIDEANTLVAMYMAFYNSIIALLDSLDEDAESSTKKTMELAESLVRVYDGDRKSLADDLINRGEKLTFTIFRKYSFQPSADYDEFIDRLEKKIGSYLGNLILVIMKQTELLEKKQKPIDLLMMISSQVILSSRLHELRKKELLQSRQTGEKKPGRNDPCPCGSGKKYKNCCL